MSPQIQEPNPSSRRALLVGVILPGKPPYVVEEHLDELEELARTAGVAVVGRAMQQRKRPDPATFIGRGKAAELAGEAVSFRADLLLFDDDLSASQAKNVEEATKVAVMDRSSLILEIFHQRARTREARTQVELAQLTYLLPRLTRRWRHLSRQEGGIGVRGGAGETQLEADRRQLRTRIAKLKKDLAKIERTRAVQRQGRREALQVSLAGYTNAGKSTLFNRLTNADAHAEDKLFATLDPKLRRGYLGPERDGARGEAGDRGSHRARKGHHSPREGSEDVVFADTVGFIRKLPHHLVASFRSTLEEVSGADLVLHVIDRSHPQWQEQMEVANEVLAELGVAPERILAVYNKTDLLPGPRSATPGEQRAQVDGVHVSARTGAGIPELRSAVARRLAEVGHLVEPAGRGRRALPAAALIASEVEPEIDRGETGGRVSGDRRRTVKVRR